ncbi:Beta-xylosidase/alpha-L-arabinofuranosidase 2 [Cardamine amara subsp. amara]|uniref:Beta-xylosidase/alpha-L-arabinofuranosidase 2 n=1 Tax=Cardamine amara subsp. amara TaxID=228776 RepID=A0ABD0ZT88_CARAN
MVATIYGVRSMFFSATIVILFAGRYGGAAAAGEYIKYKDPKAAVEERVEDLLARMTLPEKLGQMCQVDRFNYSMNPAVNEDIFTKYMIGSVLSNPYDTGASPLKRVLTANTMQKLSLSTRLGIPLLYAIDAVHGHNTFINATIFPHNVGLGATRDPELVKKIGAITALEVRATGIAQAFAPCVAVCRDPRWGRCYESYSEDPKVVNMMTESIIDGLQGNAPYLADFKTNVAGCAKHFVADGGTVNGVNEDNTVADNATIFGIHMPPFEAADTLKFQGFVISDWLGIDRITTPHRANYTYSIEASINAGIDMVMVPWEYKEFLAELTKLVDGGYIPMSRIDDAVRRVLRAKFSVGLFENPLAEETLAAEFGNEAHREVGREAVRKSMVLLKNGKTETDKVVPLAKKVKKIVVAGHHANNMGWQCGGFTLTWQGFNGTGEEIAANRAMRLPTGKTRGTTILEAIQKAVDPTTQVIYVEEPNKDTSKVHADAAYTIVVVGEAPYAETRGDSRTLNIADPGLDTIVNTCGSGMKCLVVLVTGRPLMIESHIDMIDALAVAWLPGTEGQGVADVLYGDHPFTGTLPRTWMKRVDQLPMNVGDKNYDPLFPFGFGIKT